MQSVNPLFGPLSRWIAPTALALALGVGAMTPVPAHAQDALTRVLVDVADVVFNNGTPYYRYGDEVPSNRLVVGRDAYGRPVYYRQGSYNGYPDQQRIVYDRYGRPVYDNDGRRVAYSRYNQAGYNDRHPPYGNAYGYYRHHGGTRCDQDGDRCWNQQHNRHGDDGDRDHDYDRRGRDRDQGDDNDD